MGGVGGVWTSPEAEVLRTIGPDFQSDSWKGGLLVPFPS